MLLVIDSASGACSAALVAAGAAIDARHEIVGRGHAERLIPMIDDLLAGRWPTGILVDCGPGSFTGIRVGLAAASGLAIGWGVPLTGYSSMALTAASAPAGEAVTVAVTGGHGQLFVQSYGGDPLRALDDLRSLDPDDAAAAPFPHAVYGSGAATLVAVRGHGEAHDPGLRAADAIRLPAALRSLPPLPIYGRAPDARPMSA